MGKILPAAVVTLALVFAPGCEDTPDAASAEGGEASAEGDEATGEATGDDKYVLGGKTRPAWLETLVLANKSWELSLSGTDFERAAKLALMAVDLAEGHPELLGYCELTIAFAELRRGKLAHFERLMVRGLGRIPVDEKHTEIALLAAEQSVKRGRIDPSRQMLGLWRKRLVEAGEDALAQKVEAKAEEHLERVRGKSEDEPADKKIEFGEPPADFPIIL